MSRQVITKTVTIAGSGYASPAKTLVAGTVVELSASELAAFTGAGGTARVTAYRDQTGEQAGVSNSN
jgi:hypothetical protein